jgi:hypothetical protein
MTAEEYMREIVEPTILDLVQNRASKRHAFLACVVTYHTIDYLCGKRRKAVLRREFREQSAAFAAVDRISNARSDTQSGPRVSASHIGEKRDETDALSASGVRAPKRARDQADFLRVVRAAADFLASKAQQQRSQEDSPANDTFYAVIPFHRNAQGDLEPGLALEAINAVLAERLARRLAAEHDGAVAFSRTGDRETGEFQDAVVLAQFGEVDLGAVG